MVCGCGAPVHVDGILVNNIIINNISISTYMYMTWHNVFQLGYKLYETKSKLYNQCSLTWLISTRIL